MIGSKVRNFSNVVVVSAKRTPVGGFMGSLSQEHPSALGTHAIKAALEQASLDPAQVDEVFMGNVLQAGGKQAPARQATLNAGIPEKVPCTTVNKVCASGMKSVMLGAQTIKCGDNQVVVAGGFESMSKAPFYLTAHRSGQLLGASPCEDAIMYDGLTCAFNKVAMGNCAEETIKKHGITREAQDEYCIESYKRAAAAYERGFFNSEIATVTIADRKGTKEVSIDEDYAKVKFDKVPMLKPVFGKDGTITAANASSINDGGVALILMSEAKATELNLAPIARILGYGDAATSPVHFGEAPYGAVMQALERAGKTLNDVDLHEINEAFSSVVLVNMKLLGIDHSIVNVNGGAVSIGHPIGASGGRILATLIYALKEQGKKLGMASICNGGGGASAVLLESL